MPLRKFSRSAVAASASFTSLIVTINDETLPVLPILAAVE